MCEYGGCGCAVVGVRVGVGVGYVSVGVCDAAREWASVGVGVEQ